MSCDTAVCIYKGDSMSETTTWPDDFSTEEFAYLTTIGRSSGKPHRIQIWFAVDNGRVYLMSGGRDR